MRHAFTKPGFIFVLLTVLVVLPIGIDASPSKTFGIRAGAGIDPDQFAFGLHGRIGELVSNVLLAPSADVGFGESLTIFTGNLDLLVPLSPPDSRSALYLGGGPTLAHLNPEFGDGDTELGVSLVAGVKLPFGRSHHWTIEGRYGIGDIPELRFMLGILFGSQPRSNR